MKASLSLRLFCGVALMTVALASQARADQEISATYWKSTTSFAYELYPGSANCYAPNSWCTSSSDYIEYGVWASWSDGYAYMGRTGGHVSSGDTAFIQIAQWCDDGSFGYNYNTGSGPDGGLPNSYAESDCFTASGDYGTSYEVTFTYGVSKTGSS